MSYCQFCNTRQQAVYGLPREEPTMCIPCQENPKYKNSNFINRLTKRMCISCDNTLAIYGVKQGFPLYCESCKNQQNNQYHIVIKMVCIVCGTKPASHGFDLSDKKSHCRVCAIMVMNKILSPKS